MAQLPKLKVSNKTSNSKTEIHAFEEAKKFPYNEGILIIVEGQQIFSYQDLLKLVSLAEFKRKRILEVTFFPMISGG